MIRFLLIALTAATLVFSSCSKDKERSSVLTVTVASVLWENPDPIVSEIDYPYKLFTKTGNETEWVRSFLPGEIKGFVFEPGYECVLEVLAVEIPNPPMDAPGVGYSLIRVISKEKKDSEGIPGL